MEHRRFRFGINLAGSPRRAELKELLARAEDCGFSVALTADHLTERHAVLPLLAVVAEISSMRVSPMVLANDYRHPVVTARDTATIDILSGGRFELGIGTGWIKDQYDAAGLSYDSPRVRVDRLEEAVAVIRGVWSGEPFTFEGDHYQVDRIRGPKPAQEPHPPILIAGSGRRMMALAGRAADIVGISPLRPSLVDVSEFGSSVAASGDRIKTQLDWIRDAAGTRFDDLELSVTISHLKVTDDADAELGRLASEWGSTPGDIAQSLHTLVGSRDQIGEVIEERRENFGISYMIFSSLVLDDVGPIVAGLA
jgi:probable F420-dependent oxidoreductase